MATLAKIDLYDNAANWKGCEIASATEWHTYLTSVHIAELKQAVDLTIKQGLSIADIKQDYFPLPTLGIELKRIYDEVIHGRGFAVLHNMPVDEFGREEIIRAYIGLGIWLGEPVSQNHKGHIVGHVKDIGADPKNKLNRTYTTSAKQPYHTDSADMAALMCLKPPKSGGIFSISSIVAIYNEMQKTRPDLVEVLEQNYIFDRKGEIPEGKKATYEMPVFHRYKGRLLSMLDRNFIDAALEREDVPRLTPKQEKALDLFGEIAAREDFCINMQWQAGDIGLVHNHTTVHARTDYEDFDDFNLRRHLIRLWLSTNYGWELPPVFAERYGAIAQGQKRGGIIVPGMKLTCPLEAE